MLHLVGVLGLLMKAGSFVTAGGLAWWCARRLLWRRGAHMTHLIGL